MTFINTERVSMKITKVEQSQKNKTRYNIYCDQQFILSVSEHTLIKFVLLKDKDITQDDLEKIKQYENYQRVYDKAIQYISYKLRSVDEMKKYLRQLETTELYITQVVDKLLSEGYLDDNYYAQCYVSTVVNTTDKGPLFIQQKLTQYKIDKMTILNAIESYSPSQWQQRLTQRIDKFMSKQNLPKRALIQKIMVTYQRKGYASSMIQEVLSTIDWQQAINSSETQQLIDKVAQEYHRKYAKKYEGYQLKTRLYQALQRKGFDYDDIQRVVNQLLEEV